MPRRSKINTSSVALFYCLVVGYPELITQTETTEKWSIHPGYKLGPELGPGLRPG